jgi:thiosulfate reductase cytochrome b subunit
MDPAVTVTGHSTGSGPVAAVSGETRVVPESAATTTATAASLRQSRVEMSKIDLWSALKVSLCFYLAGLALLIVTGLVVWLLLDASGGIRSFERFMGDILSAKNFHFVAPQILLGSVLVGLVLVALMSILTVIAAALYNVFADLVGGIEVTLTETD